MNLGQLASAVYGDLGYTQGTTEVQTRTYRWLNEAHKKILRDPSLIGLRQIELSFSTVANQAMYGLPQAFERIDNIVQVSTSRRLRFMTMDRMKLIDPGNRTKLTNAAVAGSRAHLHLGSRRQPVGHAEDIERLTTGQFQ